MTLIQLSEVGQHPDGSFRVRVGFDDASEYEVQVRDPADVQTERLLAWYFEEHLRYPFLDQDLERQAVTALAEYGGSLFSAVFGGEAAPDYRRLRERSFDGCTLEVTGSAGFHLLHWEALRDPELAAPLAVRMPVIRRATLLPSRFLASPQPTLNILLVTARPFGRSDVGYRTISRPLADAVRFSSVPVTLDLVRPGTWDAFREHLRAATRERGPGWYQVVHFDLHGAVGDYGELTDSRESGRLSFRVAGVAPFEGRRPFLFFETADEGRAAPVPADTVASLLAEHRIPVAVLNACQSAMQAGSEVSLAEHLVRAGIPVAIGMAYSVTVTAAVQAMRALYGQLTRGASPAKALHAARQALHDDPARRAYFDQDLDLQDWVLPVGFSQQQGALPPLRPMTDTEQADFYARQAGADEPATEYGFVGRDLDVQAVERRLLAAPDNNELLLTGLAGAGKSTLLTHLAWWWQRTGLVEQAFRFSWEERAWTAAQIVRDVRARLLGPVEQARADLMPPAAQVEHLASLLRATPHLLILDNFESVTAAPAAIPHALDLAERDYLRTLLTRLKGGRTLVLIGSRQAEEWLAPGTFDGNLYPLPGLDPQAASALTDRILRRHQAAHWLTDDRERQALQDLVALLGGYPLPMAVVLPGLAVAPPSRVLAELKAGEAAADPSQRIIAAIEYSHGRLDPGLQESLLMLAPFTAVIPPAAFLADYQQALLPDVGVLDLGAAIAEAVRVGLASPHPQLDGYVRVQPVLPYFLRSRLVERPELKEAADQAFYQLYSRMGGELYSLLTTPGDPRARAVGQAVTRAEYANLTTALAYALGSGLPLGTLVGLLDEYLDQAGQTAARRELLDDAIARYFQPADEAQQRELALLHNLAGAAALGQNRLDDARRHYETELQLREAAGDRRHLGGVYHQLGVVAAEQRRYAEAEASYRRALDASLEYGDRRSAASTYHQLGRVAQEERRFAEAEASYRQALAIKLEYGDRLGAVSTYHQLGRVAQEERRFAEAEASYRQALDISLEYDDQLSAASTLHQLGMVAQEQQRFEAAEASYRRALAIKLEYGDRLGAARSYYQLGAVAQQRQQLDEAEARYLEALSISLEYGDEISAAGTLHQLGIVAELQGRYDEGADRYRRALGLYLEHADLGGAGRTLYQLGGVSAKKESYEEAEVSYQRAFDVFTEIGDLRSAAAAGAQLGSVYEKTGRHAEAARFFLRAASVWRQQTGRWDESDLQQLRRERVFVRDEEFAALTKSELPSDLVGEFTNAIRAPVGEPRPDS